MIEFPLAKGETLLWSGTPRQGLVLRPSDARAIPFSLMWGGFAIFWEFSVIRTDGPVFMKLWGVPFVLIGLYITIGRFFTDARRRTRTTCGLTSERIIIASSGFHPTLQSLSLTALPNLSITERPDGSGTIIFAQRYNRSGDMLAGRPDVTSFEMIPNAKTVYDMIRDAQKASAR